MYLGFEKIIALTESAAMCQENDNEYNNSAFGPMGNFAKCHVRTEVQRRHGIRGENTLKVVGDNSARLHQVRYSDV